MCHFSRRPERATEPAEETDTDEIEDSPGFAEMEEAEDVRIVTDGGDE
jgi:hypothetical protein